MLANWFFFWDESAWTGVSPSPSPTPAPESRGGGHKKQPYAPLPEDFWDVRARYLRRFVEPTKKRIEDVAPIPPASAPDVSGPNPALLLRQAFEAAAARAAAAKDMIELRDVALRMRIISLDISKIQQQYNDRAIALLLLDVF